MFWLPPGYLGPMRRLLVCLTIPVLTSAATVREVRLDGLSRTREAVVRRVLAVRPGDEADPAAIRRDADAGRLPAAVPEFVPGNTLALPRPGQARIARDEAVRSLSALLERCAARRAEKGK